MQWWKAKAPEQVVELLNELLELDADAINALIRVRVDCNECIGNHATVQVRSVGNYGYEGCEVGLLGILNGVFGTDGKGIGAIGADFNEEGILKSFRVREYLE